MPTIVHFEIPANDIERARRFYSTLFGWEFKEVPGRSLSLAKAVKDDNDEVKNGKRIDRRITN